MNGNITLSHWYVVFEHTYQTQAYDYKKVNLYATEWVRLIWKYE